MNSIIKVLIVDDHELVRVGLRSVLSQYDGIDIVGEADSVNDGIEKAKEIVPDVVLMDVRLPDGTGFRACREIKNGNEKIKILFLSSYSDDDKIYRAIESGADGYLLKEINCDDLVNSIGQVAEGKSVLDPVVVSRFFMRLKRDVSNSPQQKLEALSRQEMRVLKYVSQGLTNKEVAQQLKLSDKTVKNYLKNALEKLGLNRRTEGAAFYIKHFDG